MLISCANTQVAGAYGLSEFTSTRYEKHEIDVSKVWVGGHGRPVTTVPFKFMYMIIAMWLCILVVV